MTRNRRRYPRTGPVRIGITGTIGSGKSTVAGYLRDLGVPVFDADAAARKVAGPGGAALPAIARAFPQCVANGVVDRKRLGGVVFNDPAALARLEAIIHPMVRTMERRFLRRWAQAGADIVGFDIPLLFETGAERRMDVVWTASAPARVRDARVLGRPGMSRARLDGILAQQWSDAAKRRAADDVVRTGLDHRFGRAQVVRLLNALRRSTSRL